MAAKKKQIEDDEDDAPQRSRKRGDEEEGGSGEAPGFSVRQLVQRTKDWAAENRILAMIAGAGAALFVLTVIALIVWRVVAVRNRPTVESAVTAFEFGAYHQARVYAESVLRYAGKKEYEKRSDALFVLGASLVEQHQDAYWTDRDAFFLAAANHLKEAYTIGFSEDFIEQGLYYYGKALYLSADMPRAVEILLKAEENAKRHRKDIAWLLADALTRTEHPDFNRALEFSDEFLRDPTTTQLERYEGMLLQTQILLRLGRYDEAVRTFDRVPVVDELEAFQEFVCAQILMEEARDFRRRAMTLERELLPDDSPFEIPHGDLPHGAPSDSAGDVSDAEISGAEISGENPNVPPPDASPSRENLRNENGNQNEKPLPAAPVPAGATKIPSPRTGTIILQVNRQSPISETDVSDGVSGSDRRAYSDLQEYRTKSLQRYREAVLRLEMCKDADVLAQRYTREAILLQGMCYEEMGEFTKAAEMYRELVRQYPDASEAIAGEFLHAELLRRQGRFPDALAGYDRAARNMRRIAIYANPWLSRREMRSRIERSVESLFELKEFREAFELLAVFRGIVPVEREARMNADGYERWGRELKRQADAASFEPRQALMEDMREKYRTSGRWYEELTKIDDTSPYFADFLRSAAENYRLGKNSVRAIRMYREFLKNELVEHRAETLVTLGQLYFELDLLDRSIETFDVFFEEYPRHPLIYRARLMKSYALFESGETDRASILLLENLSGVLAPEAPEYRDSIYALGRLYNESGDGKKAVETLENATYLHPEAPQAAQGHYMIAQSYLKIATESQKRKETTNLVTAREQANLETQNARRSAWEHFIKARDALNRLEQDVPLARSERTMQMICYFEIAKQELALGRPEDALVSFEAAQLRFQERPETLDAIIQVALIYRTLGKPQQASEAITRGKVLLQKLTETKAFPPDYRFNEKEWNELLQWQSNI